MKFAARSSFVVLTIAFAACSRGERGVVSGGPGFVDADGQAVDVKVPVHRIVSTMQSATEWLVKMGDANLLVARTDFDRQPDLAALPSIGGGLDPSAEAVAALKPDVVIGWRNRSSSDLQHALASFHIPVLSFETTDTADLFRNLARLGVLANQQHVADSLATDLRDQLATVKRAACGTDTAHRESVMIVLWTDPPMTAGGGTWLSTLLETVCLRNAFEDVAAAWPTVSLEAISQRQPDWLLVSKGETGQRLEELKAKPGWRELKAVQNGKILEIPGDLFARAGPSIGEAARAILAARKGVSGD